MYTVIHENYQNMFLRYAQKKLKLYIKWLKVEKVIDKNITNNFIKKRLRDNASGIII